MAGVRPVGRGGIGRVLGRATEHGVRAPDGGPRAHLVPLQPRQRGDPRIWIKQSSFQEIGNRSSETVNLCLNLTSEFTGILASCQARRDYVKRLEFKIKKI